MGKIKKMPHSYYKIWVHAVWATKERFPIIKQESEREIHNLMKEQFKKLDCPVRIINGMPDHVHCLFLLNPKKTIADILQQVKGGSAYAINAQNIIKDHFNWQTGYGVFSVSESQLERVYNYIKNQKSHHAKKSFNDEYEGLLKLNGLD